jgi:hypothetical protein
MHSFPMDTASSSLVADPDGSARLRKIERDALNDKGLVAVEYMLAYSEPLRDAVRLAMARVPDWGPSPCSPRITLDPYRKCLRCNRTERADRADCVCPRLSDGQISKA